MSRKKAQVVLRNFDEAHALGLAVIPWTVNEPEDMHRLVGWGVDGIVTDRPDRARWIVASAGAIG